MKTRAIDLTGQKFGRYLVISRRGKASNGGSTWLCRCECGAEKVVQGSTLRRGDSKSCGCLMKDLTAKRMTTHGNSRHELYPIWRNMLSRCYDIKDKEFKNYGGRGIGVCDRWMDVTNFIFDMSPRKAGGTLDRINNNGDYCPENCRWATPLQQGKNKRNNRYITFKGQTKTVCEWARLTGINQSTISMRLTKYGWTPEKALSIRPGG